MANFKDIIKLLGDEHGKIFVVDDSGDLKFVVMPAREYQRMLVGKIEEVEDEVEQINREIVQAQLEDVPPTRPAQPLSESSGHISGSLKNRMATLRKDTVFPKVTTDAQSEVETIDPSFNFENPRASLEDI